MPKVRIKSWRDMEDEFGTDISGTIECKNLFTPEMEALIPLDRVIEVDEPPHGEYFRWRGWSISEDMIAEIAQPPKLFKLRNTNLEIKEKHFDEFMEQIRSELVYGGSKYKPLNPAFPDKETTDYLVDAFPEFIESTVMKYMMRWRNQHREEDLIKVASYMYIMWLKYFTGENAEHNKEVSKNLRGKK